MVQNVFFENVRNWLVLLFAVGFLGLGLYLLLQVAARKVQASEAVGILLAVILLGGFLVWASYDFTGPKEIIAAMGAWFKGLFIAPVSFINLLM